MARRTTRKGDSSATIGFEAKLWLAADKLRNNMDAAEYKHVVLGLIFLKYISDTFEEHRARLLAGQGDYEGANPEDPDEYKAENVFWVPADARWSHLQAHAKQPAIGRIVDDAMVAIERDNPRRTLKGGTIAPYLDVKNLPTQGHSAEQVIDREFSSGTKFQNGDTLLARITPCLENGKTGYVDFLEGGQVGWGSTEYIVLAPKPPLPPQFGYLLARSDALRSHAIQNMTGTSGRQRVPSECFKTFWLAVPPPEIARRFDELTAPLMAKIKANSTESRTLATLRDTLLPKLLSGELPTSNFTQGENKHAK